MQTATSSLPTTDEAPGLGAVDAPEDAPPRVDEDGRLPGSDLDRPGTELALRRCDAPAALPEMMRLAGELAEADILPRHLRRRPANVLALMFAARALDIPVWTAFQALHLIDGKVGMDATFQRALIVRAGHRFRVIERTDERAAVEIVRHDDPAPRVSEFTWADAVAAGLTGKDNWRHYPKAMLMARVTTLAIRDHCPEVLFTSSYAPEELDVTLDDAGQPVTLIPSERVHDADMAEDKTDGGADGGAGRSGVVVRSADAAAALRADYRRRIDAAQVPEDLNNVWKAAKAGGLLGAPLEPGLTVEQALWARSDEIRLEAEARAALAAQGLEVIDVEPGPEPPSPSRG